MRLSCLRLLKTSIKHKQVEKGEELKDEDIEALISSAIRKGQEAAQEFNKGNREDLAAKEEAEIKILYDYLPKQLDSVFQVLDLDSLISLDGRFDADTLRPASQEQEITDFSCA